jgi:hypothetical protein
MFCVSNVNKIILYSVRYVFFAKKRIRIRDEQPGSQTHMFES